ncbi:MAG: metallophosphoesterase [Dehalococcoidia bacterium]|nr:metallophosphoesterase [Dehalococcoidia bacterium]
MGGPGRRAVQEVVPGLRRKHGVDLVIANGENTAGGRGLTAATAYELLNAGVDVITSGNHIWDNKEVLPLFDSDLPIIRPTNYPPQVPGRGEITVGEVTVINLMGRTFMASLDCPFRTMDSVLGSGTRKSPIIVVDFHAEATSEKVAMGWYLDGRVSAVVGTHTHVPTADAKILPKGTAYVSDLGMTGPSVSVIGCEIKSVINRFLTQMPVSLPVASGPAQFNSVLIEVDGSTGLATKITRIDLDLDKE